MTALWIGWTTLQTQADALELAKQLVEARLVACAQVDGPITSVYAWQGQLETTEEWRLMVKFTHVTADAIPAFLTAHHPYATPQWLAVEATEAAPAYLEWVSSCIEG